MLMLTTIQDSVKQLLPNRARSSSSGWVSFNAVCCHHRGESADTRNRGGVKLNAGGAVTYHCFNCQFKTSYSVGRHLSFKFRKWLSWLGADENTIKRLVIDAIRVKDMLPSDSIDDTDPEEPIVFTARQLPANSQSFQATVADINLGRSPDELISDHMLAAATYMQARGVNVHKYDFYVTDVTAHNLHQRVIVPMVWQSEIVGYTARALVPDIKPKYHSQYEPNFVFNVDAQTTDRKFVIVCEGPFDAMAIDGVSVLGNECSEQQAEVIDRLKRQVIVVPDADRAGALMVDLALEYGWNVSFPVWQETCKDVNAAVVKYGKLFVIKTILDSMLSSRLKIELRKKKLYG